MQLSPGVRIRSFEVIAPLGAGGMGAVYRARDPKLGRDIAIKFLQDELTRDREYLHRFEREARAASALNHPNIITIYEIGDCEGAPFIAMELVDGASLRDLLKKGPLPLRKLLDIASQIADGLAAAHERGIVHRDLKPDNVMVTPDGRVKILDFGLARMSRSANSGDSTSELSSVRTPAGRVVGTASYVSPEQASGNRHADYRSDQFSFGSLLYELATGRRAFARNSTIETLAAIVRDEPEPLQRVNPQLPPPLVWIIERCMAKDPNERYASTRDLANELRMLRDRLSETSPGRLRRPLTPRKRMAIAAISAAVLIAAVAIIAASGRFRRPSGDLPPQKYLAVLPFHDRTGRPDGALFSEGFADAVSARLGKYPGIQVIPPSSFADLLAKRATPQRIAQQVGATLLLDASLQRSGGDLRVSYSVVEPKRGTNVIGDVVNGPVQNIWALQDETADAIARDLGARERRPATPAVGLNTAEEQDLYIRALGALDHPDDEKSIDTAVNTLHDLLETAADSPLVYAALGRAYLAKYNSTRDRQWAERAIRACTRARELDPDQPDVVFTTGEVQRLTGQYTDAIAEYQRAIAARPDSPEAVIGLARAYQGAKQFDDADRAFRRGIALRPTWWYGYHYLGILDLSRGRYADADRQFARVIALNPQNPWGYINRGNIAVQQGNLHGAAAFYAKAIALRPDPDAYSNLGYCYYYTGDYAKAADCARKAIALKPAIAAYWASLGDACRWLASCRAEVPADYNNAIASLRKELSVNPNNARALASLAVCLAQIGEASDAKRFIKKALDIEPQNPTRMFQAARVANALHDSDSAISWLKRAITAGYQSFEVERDPEFSQLRSTAAFRRAFNPSVENVA